MENITVKKHLVIALIFAILILIFSFKSKHKRKLLINLFLGTYIVIIAYVIFYDIYLQYYLNSFDIDKNGFFNGDEITIEQKKAMQKLSSDTERNFSFITGLFYSAILSGILYKLVGITKKPNG
ncbi:hypothetical protein [Flavobacterium sp.]|jgi:4-amino-4-deoxy-L-arabinose transferase-like glycosyltransferase|uniref:hypothetical protein n=1 Tax=Flavobacterium sp. TaxID=239 RepID=UPI0040470C06